MSIQSDSRVINYNRKVFKRMTTELLSYPWFIICNNNYYRLVNMSYSKSSEKYPM